MILQVVCAKAGAAAATMVDAVVAGRQREPVEFGSREGLGFSLVMRQSTMPDESDALLQRASSQVDHAWHEHFGCTVAALALLQLSCSVALVPVHQQFATKGYDPSRCLNRRV